MLLQLKQDGMGEKQRAQNYNTDWKWAVTFKGSNLDKKGYEKMNKRNNRVKPVMIQTCGIYQQGI